jgi:hypothetical protein
MMDRYFKQMLNPYGMSQGGPPPRMGPQGVYSPWGGGGQRGFGRRQPPQMGGPDKGPLPPGPPQQGDPTGGKAGIPVVGDKSGIAGAMPGQQPQMGTMDKGIGGPKPTIGSGYWDAGPNGSSGSTAPGPQNNYGGVGYSAYQIYQNQQNQGGPSTTDLSKPGASVTPNLPKPGINDPASGLQKPPGMAPPGPPQRGQVGLGRRNPSMGGGGANYPGGQDVMYDGFRPIHRPRMAPNPTSKMTQGGLVSQLMNAARAGQGTANRGSMKRQQVYDGAPSGGYSGPPPISNNTGPQWGQPGGGMMEALAGVQARQDAAQTAMHPNDPGARIPYNPNYTGYAGQPTNSDIANGAQMQAGPGSFGQQGTGPGSVGGYGGAQPPPGGGGFGAVHPNSGLIQNRATPTSVDGSVKFDGMPDGSPGGTAQLNYDGRPDAVKMLHHHGQLLQKVLPALMMQAAHQQGPPPQAGPPVAPPPPQRPNMFGR